MQHPSAVPVPPVKQGCCLPPCSGRGQCQSMFRRGGTTNKGRGGGRGDNVKGGPEGEEEEEEGEKMQANPAYLPIEMSYK